MIKIPGKQPGIFYGVSPHRSGIPYLPIFQINREA